LRYPAAVTSYKRRAEVDAGLARIAVEDVLEAIENTGNAGI